MKTVFSNSEVPHVWATQKQEEGRNATRSIFFRGPVIYSYGQHWPMGNIIKAPIVGTGGVVLLNSRTYGPTTSGHQQAVNYAVNHMERVFAPYVMNTRNDHFANLEYWTNKFKSILKDLANPRKRPATKDSLRFDLRRIAASFDAYSNAVGFDAKKRVTSNHDETIRKEFLLYLSVAVGTTTNEDFEKALKTKAIAEKRRKTLAEKANAKKWSEYVAGWLKGEVSTWQVSGNYSFPTYLRLSEEGDKVETSKGATVPVKAAKVLFDRIRAGRDVVGFKVGDYTVISINGVLKVGCHEIERAEIERFAKSQGWDK